MTSVRSFPRCVSGGYISVDEKDYLVVSEMLLRSTSAWCSSDITLAENIVHTRSTDPGKHIHEINCFRRKSVIRSVPNSIGSLKNLLRLHLSGYIKSIPPSIGRLEKLEQLLVGSTASSLSLPEEIGGLVNLKLMDLGDTEISSLPSSIGQLRSLERLYLFGTRLSKLPVEIGDLSSLQILNLKYARLFTLPVEIGNLVSLQVLNLSRTYIRSLPSSIGQLQSLKVLDLSDTTLLTLPDEIGNLVSLQTLDLHNTKIKSLPLSIGQLHNLVRFVMANDLKSLPAEIGNLTNLEILDLRSTEFAILPRAVRNLRRLKTLRINSINVDGDKRLLELLSTHQVLGCLGDGMERQHPKLGYALACNRARFRVHCEIVNGGSVESIVGLWAHLLKNAIHVFKAYPGIHRYMSGWNILKPPFPTDDTPMEETHPAHDLLVPDALYRILLEGRGSFVNLLINHSL